MLTVPVYPSARYTRRFAGPERASAGRLIESTRLANCVWLRSPPLTLISRTSSFYSAIPILPAFVAARMSLQFSSLPYREHDYFFPRSFEKVFRKRPIEKTMSEMVTNGYSYSYMRVLTHDNHNETSPNLILCKVS